MKTNRNARARNLARQGGRMSIRQRLKSAIKASGRYYEMWGAANAALLDKQAELQAARYAAKQYRRRWIWTMVALALAGLAVAIGLVVG